MLSSDNNSIDMLQSFSKLLRHKMCALNFYIFFLPKSHFTQILAARESISARLSPGDSHWCGCAPQIRQGLSQTATIKNSAALSRLRNKTGLIKYSRLTGCGERQRRRLSTTAHTCMHLNTGKPKAAVRGECCTVTFLSDN
jgi:hypothetical protein